MMWWRAPCTVTALSLITLATWSATAAAAPMLRPVVARGASVSASGAAASSAFKFNASKLSNVGWEELRAAIDNFDLVPDVVVSVGDARGELFRHAKGSTSFDTQMTIASATKWVSGVVIMSAVDSGFLSLDDLAYTRLPYWTRDPNDARSRVTLRHLLSFVSGMSGSTACPSELDFAACVQDMYARSTTSSEPGSTVVYNEVHLMYAGAMASAASGVSMEALFDRYVFGPAGMTSTFWNSAGGRPLLGSGLSTTPSDYGKFLDAYFNGRLVTPATRAEMERSHYPEAALTGVAALQGRYGLANWFQCIPSIPDFRDQCQLEDVHMSVGASGYYPITDRRFDFWMNIGTNTPGGAAVTSVMALAVKPVADEAVLASRPPAARVAALVRSVSSPPVNSSTAELVSRS